MANLTVEVFTDAEKKQLLNSVLQGLILSSAEDVKELLVNDYRAEEYFSQIAKCAKNLTAKLLQNLNHNRA